MATITANTGSGNWNVNGTWVGGVQPSATSDVVIPASASVTVPAATTVLGRSVTVQTSGTLIFAATTSQIDIGDATVGAGNVAFSNAGTITLTGIGTLRFISTSTTVQTITSGGQTLPNITLNGSGGKWQLADNLTSSGTVTNTLGTWDTNSKTCSYVAYVCTGTTARTTTMGSSAITLTGTSTVWSMSSTTGTTITSNTAIITIPGTGATWSYTGGGGLNLNGASLVFTGSGTQTITNTLVSVTMANLTRTGTASKVDVFSLNTAGIIVTGTATFGGNSTQGINRLFVASSSAGAQRTITAAAYAITGDVNFADMNLAYSGGASWTNTGSANIGDAGNNTGAATTNANSPVTQTRIGKGTLTGSYLSLPGVAGNSASAPDIAAYTGSGVMRGAVRVALADWTNVANTDLISHWQSANGSRGWTFFVANTTGVLTLVVSSDGIANTVSQGSSSASLTDGQTYWLGFNYDTTTGVLDFYKADGSSNTEPSYWGGWTLISNHTVTATVPFNSDQPLSVGTRGDGITNPAKGNFYRALFYTNATTLQFDADFTAETLGTTSFTEDSSNAATVTINSTGNAGGNWSDNLWTSRIPLPQDDAIIDSAAGGTITMDMPRVAADVDFTGFTGTAAFTSLATVFYGSIEYASGMTLTGTQGITLGGRGSHTITTNNKTMLAATGVNAGGGDYTFADNYTNSANSSSAIALSSGTLTATGNVSATGTGAGTRFSMSGGTLNMGSGTWTMSSTGGGTNWSVTSGTLNADTSTIAFTDTGANAKTFAGGGKTYNLMTIAGGGAGSVTFTGANTFASPIQIAGGTKSIVWPGSTTTTFTAGGNFGNTTNVITMTASAGSATLSFGSLLSADYLNLTNIPATGVVPAYAGTHSTDGGGNTNWVFTAPSDFRPIIVIM